MILIVAHANNNVIGSKNRLPWKCPADMSFFISKSKEYKNLLMGSVTASGIGALKDRNILVLGTSENTDFKNVGEVIEYNKNNQLLICGGAAVYESLLPYVNKILVTQLDIHITDGDSFFPEYENDFEEINVIEEGISNNIPYRILEMTRKK